MNYCTPLRCSGKQSFLAEVNENAAMMSAIAVSRARNALCLLLLAASGFVYKTSAPRLSNRTPGLGRCHEVYKWWAISRPPGACTRTNLDGPTLRNLRVFPCGNPASKFAPVNSVSSCLPRIAGNFTSIAALDGCCEQTCVNAPSFDTGPLISNFVETSSVLSAILPS